MGARRVLVTGAEGTIGTAVREHLADRYELVSLTLTSQEFPSHIADISDLEAIQPAFENVDAVVHLAASAAIQTPWDDVLRNNIVGTYNVFEAARQAGVARVVYASSNHAVGMYELDGAPALYDVGDEGSVDHTAELRPDSLYGVSKAYGEALGRFYMEQHGLRVFCLRIGAVRAHDDPTEAIPIPLIDLDAEGQRNRMRAVWLSRRDCAELIASCLEAEDVSWAIVYGVSGNPRRFWDLEHARELLGWEPKDAAPV
ncbi:MAG: dependent glucose-6-phosphate dehydrogenase [Gaiellales bacterium]|nr:dependent glucose-6-phosphate dehydrogenase [Gaiellales bacterium]